ncbi:thioesterase II family protein [Streptomyces boncukensis]|uniref:Thioesterase n=1 Tax=Streptomyces boncukensis TaxID=2711219 RepID=A0A6G4X5C4_9ACTN|nr:thioesterase [Streptomyces boncukensis]NGO72739.1 thioesterase [Streptomyces boncukensis]
MTGPEAAAGGGDEDWRRWVLRPVPREDAAMRLLCVPYAGGGAAAYHGWAEALPPWVEVWVLRLPGRDARLREPLRTDAVELAREAAAVCARELAEPFAVFGHSLGAFVVFELVRELRRRWGLRPAHLTVSARSAPQVGAHHGELHRLPDGAFLDAMDRTFRAVPPEVRDDAALAALLLPILRADTAMLETYRHREEAPLTCPITAAGGDADPAGDRAGLSAWEPHTTGGFALRTYPGGHFYLRPHRERLLADLSADLERALVP